MVMKIYCDICGKECKDQYTSGIGEYCKDCEEMIKDYINKLNELFGRTTHWDSDEK